MAAKQQLKQRVRIIGAGFAGLALGRTLLKHSIPAAIYERRHEARRHANGITLHAHTYRPLLEILGVEERIFRQQVAVNVRMTGAVEGQPPPGRIDPSLLVFRTPGVSDADYATTSFRASRSKLLKLLRAPLDIRSPRQVDGAGPGLAPGLTALYMDDSATPSLQGLNEWYRATGVPMQLPRPMELQTPCLVGADGTLSTVRKSLCPDAKIEVLPYVVYSGWRRTTRSVFDRVCAPAMPEMATAIETRRPGGVVLGVYVHDVHTGVVDMGFTYSRPVRAAKESRSSGRSSSGGSSGDGDPLFVADREERGEHDGKYIPEQFWEEIAALGDDLEQPFKHFFDVEMMKADGRIRHWLMRSVLMSPEDLRRSAEQGAFFIGDAVHTDPIMGGSGADNAIMDGIGLGECIAAHGISGIPDWYDSKYAEWKNGFEEGKAAIREMHSGS